MKNTQKTGLLAGILLCGLCCTLPIIGTIASIGSLAIMAAYFEKAAIAVIGIISLLFLYAFFRERQTAKSCETSCDTNCDCQQSDNRT